MSQGIEITSGKSGIGNPVRIGVDVGGTFTDIALERDGQIHSRKILTDLARPDAVIMDGIRRVIGDLGIPPGAVSEILHGTTLVTNALIERRGARTAFVTTQGFRDVIEMRSENRFEQYDLNLRLPEPLIPRRHRHTVAERVSADGTPLLQLSEGEVDRLVRVIEEGGYESVAIGLLHAYANGGHERRLAEALLRAMPKLRVSLSSIVSPKIRELPRFNTVIANAYVQPLIAAYLRGLVNQLHRFGITAPLFLLHSGGGLIELETAIEQPVRLLESGPAGGAVFAALYARAHCMDKVMSLDMGGTTAKISLIEDGAPKTAGTLEVARLDRFRKGSGMLISTPVVEMIEIGAGGGSIAHRDSLGRVAVGPRSAGSDPGPACYGGGGTRPTVTDAQLLLGRFDAQSFAGGTIPLRVDRAVSAVETLLDDDATLDALAVAVTETVDENMANAARVHAVEHGRDLEQFSIIAFGGGAPLHACRLCEKLGIDRVIIPPGAGVGSAIGFLKAAFSFETARGLYQRLDAFSPARVNAALEEMEAEAERFSGAARMRESVRQTRLRAYMRYIGQGWEIPVTLPLTRVDAASPKVLLEEFERQYEILFGRIVAGLGVEITDWVLSVSGEAPPVHAVSAVEQEIPVSPAGKRLLYDVAERRHVEAAEIPRQLMRPNCVVKGPAVITEAETSTIVTCAFTAVAQSDGALLLRRRAT
ncbi:MAG: hydantoinase/oxoprolinase family protein [Rhodobacteraceae bacterium]|nr:hydantoinase/oxoprolinase family protein [Paracoccaceae bacterium]